ncbi:MAG: signal peptidase I [bacterium]
MSEWGLFVLVITTLLIRIGIAKDIFSFPKFWLPSFLRKLTKKTVLEWVDSILTAAVFALLFILIVGRLYIIPSSSMEPYLKPGDVVIGLNKHWFYKDGVLNFERGDIVIFKPPVDDRLYIKRLIGKPNDKIMIVDGRLYVNDVYYAEEYVVYKDYYDYGPVKVPADSYFFLGDNRPNSYDSHLWSEPFVNSKQIKAKAVMIIFPPHRIKIIPGHLTKP